jgi:hypothetical protein
MQPKLLDECPMLVKKHQMQHEKRSQKQKSHGLRYHLLDLFHQIRRLHQLRHLVVSEKLDF